MTIGCNKSIMNFYQHCANMIILNNSIAKE